MANRHCCVPFCKSDSRYFFVPFKLILQYHNCTSFYMYTVCISDRQLQAQGYIKLIENQQYNF